MLLFIQSIVLYLPTIHALLTGGLSFKEYMNRDQEIKIFIHTLFRGSMKSVVNFVLAIKYTALYKAVYFVINSGRIDFTHLREYEIS